MQKWCPEPFAGDDGTASPPTGVVFRGADDTGTADGDGVDSEPLQFQRETGYTDPHSLLATLTRRERADLYELAEQDVAGTYEERQQKQAAEFAARIDESKREAAASLEAWAGELEALIRSDLSAAAAGAARLAVRIAEKIVRRTVATDHGVLTRALETILFKQMAAAPLQVFVSPRDAIWLAEQAELRSRLNLEVVSDDRRLADGDCRIRSGGREWDLTIDGQLEALGEIIEEAITTRSGVDAGAITGAGMDLDWADLEERLRLADPGRAIGRVANLVGMIVEVADLGAPVGSLCRIDTGRQGEPVLCEVVGFREDRLLVMPYQHARGIAPGCRATILASHLTVPVGSSLLGRVVDGLGRPLDGGPGLGAVPRARLGGAPCGAMRRKRVSEAVSTGIRSIDSMITTARGQRLGIFAGSGVGKSVLLGMLARQARVDVNVLALIGERGREVREFIERDLGPEGLARSVVVVVTSDESAVMRAKGADTAMTIAEHFRDSDREVLFMMDSATRYAMALREIGLAAGEPPTTKGYPPSTFAALPRLCERAGWSDINAMTAFFTVLIEGDDIHDPVGDAMRSILDGHVMLSRDLARQHHYPAVDVLGSVSRLRSDIVDAPDREAGARLMQWLKALEDNRDLVNIGAYVAGADVVLDVALAREKDIRTFLKQDVRESTDVESSLAALRALTGVEAAGVA